MFHLKTFAGRLLIISRVDPSWAFPLVPRLHVMGRMFRQFLRSRRLCKAGHKHTWRSYMRLRELKHWHFTNLHLDFYFWPWDPNAIWWVGLLWLNVGILLWETSWLVFLCDTIKCAVSETTAEYSILTNAITFENCSANILYCLGTWGGTLKNTQFVALVHIIFLERFIQSTQVYPDFHVNDRVIIFNVTI